MKKGNLFSVLITATILVVTTPAVARVSSLDPLTSKTQIIKTADWLFETNRSPYTLMGDNRAMVVSSGCDVNGDGFDDLIIGRKDYDSPDLYRNAGIAWLFLGSATGLSDTPYRTFNPPQVRHLGLFGNHVACAGDVDNDGDEEIMIAMQNYYPTPPINNEGALFVYYGSPTGPNDTYDWMARGDSVWGYLGTFADSAGDVNGDGYDDIIVGTGENFLQPDSHAYVWYGGPDGLGDFGVPSNADWVASGPTSGVAGENYFGVLVYGIGDVNGDTHDDIMVTAPLYDGAVTDQGAVFVWYGSDGGLGEPGTPENADWIATSAQSNSYFGSGGDGVGDLNGDGCDDLAVGAYQYDTPNGNAGKVFVWYGSSSGLGENGNPGNADWSAEGYIDNWLGLVARPAGDVNHDGFSDLLITAPNYWVTTTEGILASAGAWFIWKGSASGLGENGTPTNADIAVYGDQAGGALGQNEAGAADVNGDNLDDIFVAANNYDHPEPDEGVVFGHYSTINLYVPLVMLNP